MNLNPQVVIGKSTIRKAGRGVFANKNFKPGDIIETCETLIFPGDQAQLVFAKTMLNNYVFSHSDGIRTILALGNGSLYNHRKPSNATYNFDGKNKHMIMSAVEPIKKGEEIFINYGGSPLADWGYEF